MNEKGALPDDAAGTKEIIADGELANEDDVHAVAALSFFQEPSAEAGASELEEAGELLPRLRVEGGEHRGGLKKVGDEATAEKLFEDLTHFRVRFDRRVERRLRDSKRRQRGHRADVGSARDVIQETACPDDVPLLDAHWLVTKPREDLGFALADNVERIGGLIRSNEKVVLLELHEGALDEKP